jgi:hypothetical protein
MQDIDWHAEFRRTGIALTLNPGDAQALLDRSVAAYWLADLTMALDCLQRAQSLLGNHPILLRNLTRTLLRMRKTDMALAIADLLTATPPEDSNPENWALLGACLMETDRQADALSAMRRCAVLYGPGHAENTMNMANTLLATGHWAEGLLLYEQRWHSIDRASLEIRQSLSSIPEWTPDCPIDTDLIIAAEQGAGDMIMIARYLPLFANRVHSLTVIVPNSLLSLLSASFAHIENLTFVPRGRVKITPRSSHLMAMSVLHALRATPDTIPARDGYLRAAPVMNSRRRTCSRLAVGLSWQGSAAHTDDDIRSLPPELLVPFMEGSAQLDFYALSPPSMLPLKEAAPSNLYYPVAEGEGFEVTASLMTEMDLVISIDSAPCHLAGALGVPVWTLLRRHPDWRWGTGSTDGSNFWYNSMHLMHQQKSGDWSGLLEQVTAKLSTLR